MTPKEKAQELVEKFMPLYVGVTLGFAKKHWAKQSAVIAVDEVLSIQWYSKFEYNFWQEVKKEIEKL